MQCRICGETLPEKGDYCPFCGELRTPPQPEEPVSRPAWTRWLPWAGGGVAVALLAALLVVFLWPRADWYIAKETISAGKVTAWRSYRPDGQVAATQDQSFTYDAQGRLVLEGRGYEFNEDTGEYVNGDPDDAAIVYVYNRSCQLIRIEDYTASVTQPDRRIYTYHTNGAVRSCTVETPRDTLCCRQVYTYTRAGLPLSIETYRKKGQSGAEEQTDWIEYTYDGYRVVEINQYYPSGEVKVNTVITSEDETQTKLTYLDGNYVVYTYNEEGLPISVQENTDPVVQYEWAQR